MVYLLAYQGEICSVKVQPALMYPTDLTGALKFSLEKMQFQK